MRPTSLTVFGIIMIGTAVLVGFMAFPKIFHGQIEKAKMLRKGTETRRNWQKFPIALEFKLYLFNVTNPDDVQVGKKPIVEEVGPFVYEEWKEKVNLEDNPEEDTITYNMLNTFMFDQKGTLPLTGDEVIVIPHILILTFVEILTRTKPAAMTVFNKAIPQLFGNPSTIFLTATAREILFDGVLINCTRSKEFAVNVVCDQIRENPKGLEVLDEEYFKFSIFGLKNGTADTSTLTVKRGMRDVQEVGKVVLFDGKPEMDFWDGAKCNEIRGTDTTIFPPFMNTDDVWNFGYELCRSLPATYVGEVDYNGIHSYSFVATLGDMSTDPDLKCYCTTNTTCMKKGAFDLYRCTGIISTDMCILLNVGNHVGNYNFVCINAGNSSAELFPDQVRAPLIATFPHCYECADEYLNAVVGLKPDKDKHGIFSKFEPTIGLPVEGRRRLQFNIFIHRAKKITVMKQLSEEPVLVPILWIDEGLGLNSTLSAKVRHLLYRPMRIVRVVRIVMLLMGVMMIMLAIFRYYRKTKLNPDGSADNGDGKTNITQVSPAY